MNKKQILLGLSLYAATTAASFFVFSSISSGKAIDSPLPKTASGDLAIEPGAPKTEACPLNGAMYTKVEKEAWEKRRPLIIMVENSPDARPHSGINEADIVYEAVAEGGVTRFMPVFYCDAMASDVKVAPVRSVRTYFIDWASEYGQTPLFGHVGGANCSGEKLPNGNMGPCKTDKRAQAIEQLGQYGWRYSQGNDLDQFSVGAPAYIRNENRLGSKRVATEHSVVGSTEALWKEGAKRGWTNKDPQGEEWSENFTKWKFADEAPMEKRGNTANINFEFWDGYSAFATNWKYDQNTNTYLRNTGGAPHLDLETQQQLNGKNIIILFTKEYGSIDELKHNLYTTIGNGKALIFNNGKVIEGTWSKPSRTGKTIFKDASGKEIEFTRGRIWIHVLNNGTQVQY